MNACKIYVRVHNRIGARSYFRSYRNLPPGSLRRSENHSGGAAMRCSAFASRAQREQTERARTLDAAIWKNLEELGYGC